MKKLKLAMACLFMMSGLVANGVGSEIAQNAMDCSGMGADVQQFASKLSEMNKKMFCGQFNAAQRSAAMQYASQQDANGAMMTPDQAVQKVATDNNMMPSTKTPTGCPIR